MNVVPHGPYRHRPQAELIAEQHLGTWLRTALAEWSARRMPSPEACAEIERGFREWAEIEGVNVTLFQIDDVDAALLLAHDDAGIPCPVQWRFRVVLQ